MSPRILVRPGLFARARTWRFVEEAHGRAADRQVRRQRQRRQRGQPLAQRLERFVARVQPRHPVVDALEVKGRLRQPSDARAVREQVVDRDAALAVLGESRQILGDRVADVQDTPLVKKVNQGRGCPLGRGEDPEGRFRRCQDLARRLRLAGAVAAGVPDRTVEDNCALSSYA